MLIPLYLFFIALLGPFYSSCMLMTSLSLATILNRLISKLGLKFSMKNLGPVHYFLGIEVTNFPRGLFLFQAKHAFEIVAKSDMFHSKPVATPFVHKHDLHFSTGSLVDPTSFWSIIGALQYLTLTRPDLTFAVNLVCRLIHQPTLIHYQAVKQILRYVSGTADYGIDILCQSSSNLYGFSNANWAGWPLTRWSKMGYCVYLRSNCISLASKKQPTVSKSSAEIEYRFMATTTT